MKYDLQKAFPYPVLSDNPDYSDDYMQQEFQVKISLKPDEEPGRATLTADFTVNEEAIRAHLGTNACYAVHVSCAQTNYRHLITSNNSTITYPFAGGILYDKVVLMGCIIATEDIKNYYSENFHSEFNEEKFNILPGSVLAIATPHILYIDVNFNRPLQSVFELVPKKDITAGSFEYSVDDDLIKIFMRESDLNQVNVLRGRNDSQHHVMLSIYYPVLVEVLRSMANGKSIHDDKKWYRAINHRINESNIDLGDGSECYLHAQQLLGFPLLTLLNLGESDE